MLGLQNFSEDELNLFNPAFCGFLIYSSIARAASFNTSGIDYPLAFLVLPLCLNRGCRESMPNTIKTPLSKWVTDSDEVVIELHSTIESFDCVTRSAISFLLGREAISFTREGKFTHKNTALRNPLALLSESEDMKAAARMALYLGGRFGLESNTETILINFGVKP